MTNLSYFITFLTGSQSQIHPSLYFPFSIIFWLWTVISAEYLAWNLKCSPNCCYHTLGGSQSMPGTQQLALTGILQPLKGREATFSLIFNFFILILPVKILVYTKTKIFGFSSLTYHFLVYFNFLKFIQAVMVSSMTYQWRSWSCKIHCACANTILHAQCNPVQEV